MRVPKAIEAIKSSQFFLHSQTYTRQQGEFESIRHDMIMAFIDCGFSPMDLENPFIDKEGSVHLWHGDDVRIVPVEIQRYISKKLQWIQYYEVSSVLVLR
ncbi:hypothetical protein MRB53_017031 [Persea americana]|uniref:Uncharacterized protein n=1 Tax=Persea americana TaxID=3435 RepID=A0ACC2M594_PERAE|nr:hypothetical protein MRB53_017031 [Persea americana]